MAVSFNLKDDVGVLLQAVQDDADTVDASDGESVDGVNDVARQQLSVVVVAPRSVGPGSDSNARCDPKGREELRRARCDVRANDPQLANRVLHRVGEVGQL